MVDGEAQLAVLLWKQVVHKLLLILHELNLLLLFHICESPHVLTSELHGRAGSPIIVRSHRDGHRALVS